MFDALMDCAPVPPRRSLASSGSLLLHAVILLSLVVGSYLHVEPMAEPTPRLHPSDRILQVELPGAAAPPPAGASGADADKAPKPEPASQAVPDVVQPQAIPQEMPEAEPGQGGGGEVDGVVGGDPDGVPGGAVGGSPDGIPGGMIDGIPGSPLAALPETDQPIYLVGEIRPPVRTGFVKPEYPAVARKARVPGTVILEIVVGRSGDVESVKILRSDPLFDEAAIEAVKRWKYKPALQSGRPVRVYLTVRIEFGLV